MGYIGQAPTKVPLTSADITDGTIALADMAVNSVDSDQYVDGSIDLAHMSSQSVDEDNLHISNSGSNGQFLSKQSGDTGGLTWAAAGGPTVATEQSTASGTTFTFSSIPAGTSLIVISFQGLSLDDTDHFHLQIGDAGGIETSGYVSESCQSIGGGANTVTSTTAAFIIRGGNGIPSGVATLALLDDDAFTWTFGANYRLNTTTSAFSAGHKSLSAELTQLKFLTPGSGNYDGGSLNIQYF